MYGGVGLAMDNMLGPKILLQPRRSSLGVEFSGSPPLLHDNGRLIALPIPSGLESRLYTQLSSCSAFSGLVASRRKKRRNGYPDCTPKSERQ
jgi:hypothetical protein